MKRSLTIYHDPVPRPQRGRRSKYPFAQMDVGACFYLPLEEVRSPNVLASAARQWANRNNRDWKFVSRMVDGMVGIWRVE